VPTRTRGSGQPGSLWLSWWPVTPVGLSSFVNDDITVALSQPVRHTTSPQVCSLGLATTVGFLPATW
jgi:hypothetical protein